MIFIFLNLKFASIKKYFLMIFDRNCLSNVLDFFQIDIGINNAGFYAFFFCEHFAPRIDNDRMPIGFSAICVFSTLASVDKITNIFNFLQIISNAPLLWVKALGTTKISAPLLNKQRNNSGKRMS